MRIYLIGIFLSIAVLVEVFAEDYYALLDVSRDATVAEIRRKFKKLALKHHPDKNKDDPSAHDRFTRINRAYEVLKDEELRKKYDLYGEDGLKDDHFSNNYQSWDYYNKEFGIYDDDPEILTLSHSDFELSVMGSEDVWFINFYSPYCSHCHTLAPTWREVAKELDGIIRIGAVNCQDEWGLCTSQGIQSYPSLKLYPTGEFFYGHKTTDEIVKFALDSVEIVVIKLTSDNFKELNDHSLPWLVSFCSPDEDCLSAKTKTKLAGMLDNLVQVLDADCSSEPDLCKKLGHISGVVYYPVGKVDKQSGSVIHSLVAGEILKEVLTLLPEPTEVNDESFKSISDEIDKGSIEPWLLIFSSGTGKDDSFLELKKISALIPHVELGTIDCRKSNKLCQKFYVTKHPSVLLLKKGGYEWHYGRFTAHDIAVFAKDSSTSNVRALTPDDFPSAMDDKGRYFIDFFAPWCPPCMKLLPEWRKAGRQIGDRTAKFGTVDCTAHRTLCQNLNIRSYPTSVLYNDSHPHSLSGFHAANDIIEFVEDIIHPVVVQLTPETFEKFLVHKPQGEMWIVDFYAPWCGPCQQLTPVYRKLAKRLEGEAKLGMIDCTMHRHLCQMNDVHSYPTVRLYPPSSAGSSMYIRHQGWRDVENMYYWAFQYLPSLVEQLDYYSFFDVVINQMDAWLVDFYAPWCGHCTQFAPVFEKIAKRLSGTVKAAKVNCEENYNLCREAGIRAYPSLRFYPGAFKDGMSQPILGTELPTHESENLVDRTLKLLEDHKKEKLAEEERIKRKENQKLRDEF
ncbi:dnaJ homolog subfamily C member 10-like [Rhopilema esculentum]|uniref:dnaJ homolog subfamily C member 10-like n=1 Tax=Rhopilema esculentum TaxID=499914 RepID=UPI0031DF22DD|eukprot:gene13234-4057_t